MNERKKKDTANDKKDFYFSVIVSQILCFIVLVLLFFSARAGEGWEQIRERYSLLLEDDFLTSEFSSVVSGMKEYLLSGSTAFAVSGNRVEPYSQPLSRGTDESSSQAASDEEADGEAVQTASVTVETVSVTTENNKSVPLKLSYKKEQEMIFPLHERIYTSYYGERTDPIKEGYDFHKGIDLAADEGDSIMAVLDGTVSSVGEDSRSGKYVFLAHENGRVTFYCHCSEILCAEGDDIRQGETIALVGSTGYSTGPHLHFEIRDDGVSIDPLPLIENAD